MSERPSDQWVTAPDGEEFRVGGCQGHAECPVEVHEHGCFADIGACDHPDEHTDPSPAAERALARYDQWRNSLHGGTTETEDMLAAALRGMLGTKTASK